MLKKTNHFIMKLFFYKSLMTSEGRFLSNKKNQPPTSEKILMRPFLSCKCQKFTWKSENFSVTYNFKVVYWYKNCIFYLIRFEVQPQVRKILRPMSQRPQLPEVTHNSMLLWILQKTLQLQIQDRFLFLVKYIRSDLKYSLGPDSYQIS